MPDATEPTVVADPFQADAVGGASQETSPGIAAETPAPEPVPAPAPHPDSLSEAHGFPRERRCPQE